MVLISYLFFHADIFSLFHYLLDFQENGFFDLIYYDNTIGYSFTQDAWKVGRYIFLGNDGNNYGS